MLLHIKYNVTPEQRDNVQQKFKKTGALPPAGVTMKGRWSSHIIQCLNIWLTFIFSHCDSLFSFSKLILLINSSLVGIK